MIVVKPQAAVRLSIYSRDRFDEQDDDDEGALPRVFTYGQRLRFPAKLRPPRNFANAGAFDYEGYLAQLGIFALGSARMDRIEVIDGRGGSRWGQWCSRMRRSIVAKIHLLWPQDEAALLDAMLIGESSFIGRETKTGFQRTGIYHILVVSGMNIAILAGVIFWTLSRLRCPQVVAAVSTFLLSCGYAAVAESGIPILRPVIMLSIFMCARLLYRDGSMLNALGIAALGLLVFEPRALTDASFQLTFLSVLAIAGIAAPVHGTHVFALQACARTTCARCQGPFARTAPRAVSSRRADAGRAPRIVPSALAEKIPWNFQPRIARTHGPASSRGNVFRRVFLL